MAFANLHETHSSQSRSVLDGGKPYDPAVGGAGLTIEGASSHQGIVTRTGAISVKSSNWLSIASMPISGSTTGFMRPS